MKHLAKLLADNRAAKPRRLEIVAKSDDVAEVFIYDAIVSDALEAEWYGGVAPETFVKELRGITASTIHLRINSPGGSVFAARAIEQALRDHPAKVIAFIDGLAASAATFIAMAADEVVMNKGALFMIHKAWTFSYGNADDLRSEAELLDKIDQTLIQTYADKTGQTVDQIGEWMKAETWFNAQEAIDAGFADSLADTGSNAKANAWNLSAYARAPELPAPVAEQPPTPREPEPDRCDVGALLRRIAVAELAV